MLPEDRPECKLVWSACVFFHILHNFDLQINIDRNDQGMTL